MCIAQDPTNQIREDVHKDLLEWMAVVSSQGNWRCELVMYLMYILVKIGNFVAQSMRIVEEYFVHKHKDEGVQKELSVRGEISGYSEAEELAKWLMLGDPPETPRDGEKEEYMAKKKVREELRKDLGI
jgi:hypothetical protein